MKSKPEQFIRADDHSLIPDEHMDAGDDRDVVDANQGGVIFFNVIYGVDAIDRIIDNNQIAHLGFPDRQVIKGVECERSLIRKPGRVFLGL